MSNYTIEDQIQREIYGTAKAQERFWNREAKHIEQKNIHVTEAGRSLINYLLPALKDKIAARAASLALANKTKARADIIHAAGVEESALIVLKIVLRSAGAKMTKTSLDVGSAVSALACEAIARKNTQDRTQAEACKRLIERTAKGSTSDLRLAKDIKKAVISAYDNQIPEQAREMIADNRTYLQIGYDLVSTAMTLLSAAEIHGQTLNLMQLVKKNTNSAGAEYQIEEGEHFADYLMQFSQAFAEELTTKMPLVIPPKDWTNPFNGGYYTELYRERVMKGVKSETLRRRHAEGKLDSLYAALNQLQKQPLCYNEFVASTVQTLIESKIDIPFFAEAGSSVFKDIVKPKAPIILDKYPNISLRKVIAKLKEEGGQESSLHDIYDYLEELTDYHHQMNSSARASKVLEINSKVRMAMAHIHSTGNATVYQAWNADFRGRMYPLNPFSTQGDDLSKALFCLAPSERQALTERGVYWLYVHAANSWANDKVDKRPFDGRYQWTVENLEWILECGKDPIDNLKWAQADGGEKPFAFLAACREIYLNWVDKNHKCAISVAFDGTCNGIQHYGALTRSRSEASLVNVINTEKPGDIYAQVAIEANAEVKRTLSRLYQGEIEFSKAPAVQKHMEQRAETLLVAYTNKISRSMVKRPTMTFPYSVTDSGVRQQTRDVLARCPIFNGLIQGMRRSEKGSFTNFAVKTLANIIFKSVKATVTKASLVMNLFQKAAQEVGNINSTTTWMTPDFVEIENRYYQQHMVRVTTPFASVVLKRSGRDITNNNIMKAAKTLYTRKQRQPIEHLIKSEALGLTVEAFNQFSEALKAMEAVPGRSLNEQIDELIEQYTKYILTTTETPETPEVSALVADILTHGLNWSLYVESVKEDSAKEERFDGFVKVAFLEDTAEVDVAQQMSAIAPNVIHSLDATHARFAIRKATREGITGLNFVHDSFGCSPNQADRFLQIIRETFVRTHQTAFCREFYEQIVQSYELPAKAVVDLKVLLDKTTAASDDMFEIDESLNSTYLFC